MDVFKDKLYYAGIGARITPEDIGQLMTDIARHLDSNGYVLRSGGAAGADTYFERGATHKQIYLGKTPVTDKRALDSVDQFHPYPKYIKGYVRNLMARNCLQILGPIGSNRSQFVVCWTKDGVTTHKDRRQSTGGTGQAISIADHYGIPVFNLKRDDHYQFWHDYVYHDGKHPLQYSELPFYRV